MLGSFQSGLWRSYYYEYYVILILSLIVVCHCSNHVIGTVVAVTKFFWTGTPLLWSETCLICVAPLGPSTSSVYSGHKGSEYKSKKAAGDVKKKGKLDPYAYLPLQRSALNKRKKLKAAGQFKNIVKAAKSGALKGAKAKKKSKK